MRFRAAVAIHLRPGVFDPQGQAVAQALRALGFQEVQGVRVGRHVELDVEASGVEEARRRVEEMCRALLVNPVMETFRYEVLPA
jgi:phosphoribosylformylglycinamidine synthase PurS subunit